MIGNREMLAVLKASWALFFGIMFVRLSEGMLSTLIGVRGTIEGFSPLEISVIYAGYLTGYFVGRRYIPELILGIGHVRIFAAVASAASVAFLLFPIFLDWPVWLVLRVIFGFCVSGFFLVACRRLNNTATLPSVRQIILIYLVVQTVAIVGAQGMINTVDPAESELFILSSVILSFSLAPMMLLPLPKILRSNEDKQHKNWVRLIDITLVGAVVAFVPGKTFYVEKPMKVLTLLFAAPFSATGLFLSGALISALATMWAVFGMVQGLSLANIAVLISAIYIGGAIAQYPINWLPATIHRPWLIAVMMGISAGICLSGAFVGSNMIGLTIVALTFGAVLNPIYWLYMTYATALFEHEVMASAANALLFFNAAGAVVGALVVGAAITLLGPQGLFIYIASVMALCSFFALGHIGYSLARASSKGIKAS